MLKTKYFSTDQVEEAATLLKQGGLVAFPTETVYGLGADASNDEACLSVYKAKGRASDNPFIIHLANVEEIKKVAYIDDPLAQELLKQFSPGPFTLVLPKKSIISTVATAGLDTVGVRVPSHPIAYAFLLACGVPVAAPSANLSGRPSPTNALMVKAEMDGKIEAILKGGSATVGLESTVVSCLDGRVKLLRAGAISLKQLQLALPKTEIEMATQIEEGQKVLSPGQKYRHYAPSKPLFLVKEAEWNWAIIKQKLQGRKVAILSLSSFQPKLEKKERKNIFQFDNLEHYALQLYSSLATLDEGDCEVIVAMLPQSGEGIGMALKDRLLKAANYQFL